MKSIPALAAIALLGTLAAIAQDLDAGLKAYDKGDYAAAMKDWRPLADNGNARAQFLLGLLYYDGKSVPQDYAEALKWFEQSGDRGYVRAQRNLAEMYATGQGVKRDYIQAYKWFNICAAAGNDVCSDHRDWVAKKLKGSQLAAAQKLARDWKPVDSAGSESGRSKPD